MQVKLLTKHKTQAINFDLNGVKLAVTIEIKVLALVIDSNFLFKNHLDATISKATPE